MNKPLFIWAGGKNKMLKHYKPLFPNKNVKTYSEPFFGGGAVFVKVVEKYNPQEVYINDINKNIISIYKSIKDHCLEFCDRVDHYSNEYLSLNKDDRKKFYYDLRDEHAWNYEKWNSVEESAVLFFLMKTSFNGIWQINKNTNGRYGTPAGLLSQKSYVYEKDVVCYWNSILNSRKTTITSTDWSKVPVCDFTYYDPPYRDSIADYNEPFSDDDLENIINIVENKKDVWLSNRDSGDGYFENRNAILKKFPVTYTAGRRKKTKNGYEAKKAVEILLYNTEDCIYKVC